MDNIANYDNELIDEIKYVFVNYIKPLINFDEKDIKIDKSDNFSCKRGYEQFKYLDSAFVVSIHTQVFNKATRKLINAVLDQLSVATKMVLNKVNYKNYDNYKFRDALYDSAFLRGLSRWLSGGKCNEIVYHIIKSLKEWSIKTYEHNRVKYGIIIDLDNAEGDGPDFLSYIQKDVSATISNGEQTSYLLNNKGKIIRVGEISRIISNADGNHIPLSPKNYEKICGVSDNSIIGFTLTENGAICCFKNLELSVARLNGKWTIFNFKMFKKIFKNVLSLSNENFIKDIYLSCLDVAFAGTGGCIALINNSKVDEIESVLPSKEDYSSKIMITSLYEDNFTKLSRELRKELLAVDGACVLLEDGRVRAFGALVNDVSRQLTGGARAASACTLSKYGIAIKISADGYLQVYKNKEIVF